MKKLFCSAALLPFLFLAGCTPVSTVVNDVQRGLTDAQGIAAILAGSGIPDAAVAAGAITVAQTVLDVVSPALENIANEIASRDSAFVKAQKVNAQVSAAETALTKAMTALSAAQAQTGISPQEAAHIGAIVALVQQEQLALNAVLQDVQAATRVSMARGSAPTFKLSHADVKKLHAIAEQAAALRAK